MTLRAKGFALLLGATLMASAAARGQGQFNFNNRVGTEVNARFVLPTDPPGTSSVGPDFRVELFGGPAGTSIEQLQPLNPPATTMRTDRPPLSYGYLVSITPVVPHADIGAFGTVLVRVFDGSSWETASYRFERLYPRVLLGGDPGPAPNLLMGTEPLVLYKVPEPGPLLLVLLGVGALVCSPTGKCEHANKLFACL